MTGRQWWQVASAVLVGVCLALVARYLFIHTITVLVLFGLGLLLAFVLDPLLEFLERHGWPRAAAVWAVTIGFLTLVVVASILIVPHVVAEVQDAANHWQDYSHKAQVTYEQLRSAIQEYSRTRLPNLEVMPFLDQKVAEASQWLQAHIPVALQWISHQLIASIGLIGFSAILVVISFHFMMILGAFRKTIYGLLPEQADREIDQIGAEINRMLSQYLRGIVGVSVLVGITASVLLSILGVIFGTKYGLIIGLITGITYPIPYLGPFVSAVLAAFFGYVTAQRGIPWVSSLVALLAMYGVNQVFDAIITPRIVGRRVGLHPLVILFAAFTGFSLLGVPGMIIATPVAASIKILLARWLPIKGPDITVRCPRERLEIDVWGSVRAIQADLLKLRREIEQAVAGRSAAPCEPPGEGEEPEPPAPTAPTQPAEQGKDSEHDDDAGHPGTLS